MEKKMKGKEYNYYTGKLEFEGEYIKGERNRKGKEYDYKGNLKFEEEYKNRQKNGNVKNMIIMVN